MQNSSTRAVAVMAKKLLVFGLVAALLGCGAARLGYRHGETVTYWWLNSYIDVDEAQKPWVKAHIDELFRWHRRNELQDYVQAIARMQRRDLATITADDLLCDYNEAKTHLLLIADRAVPDLTELALSLSPEQIANIQKKFDKSNEKFRDDYLHGSDKEKQEFRYSKSMQKMEYWFGYFSREQEEQIRAASYARPLNNHLLMADRVQRQQTLIAMLNRMQTEKPDRPAAEKMIRQYIASTLDRFGDANKQTYFDEYKLATANMVATTMHIATPRQKEHFIKVLQDWASDFNRLAAEAKS
jgi:hypothetical protein